MTLSLAILSVLGLWTLLAVLAVGLYLIHKALQGVQGYLEKIAWGVRTIEKQTAPLGGRAGELEATLRQAADTFAGAAERFAEADRLLDETGLSRQAR